MQDYYSINKILQIIHQYHVNINALQTVEKEYKSVGVSQYGDDAVMPKGNNVSSPTEVEAVRLIENNKMWSNMMTDIKYIQQRWDRVTDEQQAMVLHLRLSGYNMTDISHIVRKKKSQTYNLLRKAARAIKSYPQDSEK